MVMYILLNAGRQILRTVSIFFLINKSAKLGFNLNLSGREKKKKKGRKTQNTKPINVNNEFNLRIPYWVAKPHRPTLTVAYLQRSTQIN